MTERVPAAGSLAGAPDRARRAAPPRTGAEHLSEYCARLSWDALDASVRTRTKELLLDHIGVAIGGLAMESTRAIHAFLGRVSRVGAASVIGRRDGAAAEWAALANGTAAHAIEMDDCTRESSLHPGVAVIPAAMAVAEEAQAGSAAFLEAVVAGYEVTMRVGAALNPGSAYARGFHPTGVAGVFGAAMAAGRILGLDPGRLTSALGIAGTMSSGSLEYLTDGAWTKRLTPGWAAHGGVVAAKLAAADFVGPATVFEGPLGFLRAYSDAAQPDRLLDGLGAVPPRIMRVAIKPYACCRYVHGIVDGVLELRRRHGVGPRDVTGIELGVLSIATSLVSDPIERKRHPRSVVDAQFSAPYAAAVALTRGRAGMDEFSVENLYDPDIRRLMEATHCHTDPALDLAFPEAMPATVTLILTDGRQLETRVDYPAGEPESPLSREEILARFIDLASPLLAHDEARAFGSQILDLDGDQATRSVMAALRTVPVGNGHAAEDMG